MVVWVPAAGGGGGGLPGGGSGPIVHEANPGVAKITLMEQMVFKILLYLRLEKVTVQVTAIQSMMTISGNAAAADTCLMNFNPADGDKIKIFDTDGVTPINNPLGSNVLMCINYDGNDNTAC